MLTVEERLAHLESRLRVAEDRLAIANLIASYGPAVDRRDRAATEAIWAKGGTYVIGDEVVPFDELADIVDRPGHLRYVNTGCSHFLSPARISLDGDTAVAVNYSTVIMHEGERWVVDRLSANRWELVRTDEGWQVERRSNRMITGVEEARALLA